MAGVVQGLTLTNTENYSGMLWSRTDNSTRFLDAIYARGRNGGRVINYSQEFILASGYALEKGSQPSISENASLLAPVVKTTKRDQESNVNQPFIQGVEVGWIKQSNRDSLAGLNLANQGNNRQNEQDFQIGTRIDQMRKDINYTMINGDYSFTKGNLDTPIKTRGIKNGVVTNRFNMAGESFSSKRFNDYLVETIANGADPTMFEIWCNPFMFPLLDEYFVNIPGFNQPATRTEGGIAITGIMTHYNPYMPVYWDPDIPNNSLLLVNIGQVAVSEKPYFDENGNVLGTVFYIDKPKPGASSGGMVYGELGCDYGAEWHHGYIYNIGA